jgi:hypothetical protein
MLVSSFCFITNNLSRYCRISTTDLSKILSSSFLFYLFICVEGVPATTESA